ncbi:MAG TPA: acyl-CoA thioesterase [Candidatus Sulfotelmatobacter sp.]|nr:acyl-CoA thioesterase [Candidatus Sulfotelmatobacter sp.]
MTLADFESTYALRREREVELGEIDMLRHVNNVRYAVWAETIRSLYFADVLGRDIAGSTGMILAKHELHYESPVKYRERVIVGGRLLRFGTKSFDFETAAWSIAQERRVFRSLATLVAFDYDVERSIAVPDAWRAAARDFELIAPA